MLLLLARDPTLAPVSHDRRDGVPELEGGERSGVDLLLEEGIIQDVVSSGVEVAS